MSIVRSIEVIAQSPEGFDDACRQAIKEAGQTIRNMRKFWIKDAECIIEDDEIKLYRVNGKISFVVERESEAREEKAERRTRAAPAMAGSKPSR